MPDFKYELSPYGMAEKVAWFTKKYREAQDAQLGYLEEGFPNERHLWWPLRAPTCGRFDPDGAESRRWRLLVERAGV